MPVSLKMEDAVKAIFVCQMASVAGDVYVAMKILKDQENDVI